MSSKILTSILITIAVIYPILIYFGLQYFDIKIVGYFVAVIFLLRALFLRSQNNLILIIAISGGTLAISSTLLDSAATLKFYPVAVNIIMFITFAYSLQQGPPMIERFARLKTPTLPKEAISYTRNLTWIWCLFFIINGAIALWTAIFSSFEIWTLYNGVISYGCIALLLSVEWLYRTLILKVGVK